MDRATDPKPAGSFGHKRAPRGGTRSKLSIHADRTISKVVAPPLGSRFKGYTSVLVQDLVIRSHVVDFRCERWQTPDGLQFCRGLFRCVSCRPVCRANSG